MNKTAARFAAAAAFASIAAPAGARDFAGYASTDPVLYRYAACIFEADAPSAEAQIEACAPLKAELAPQAEAAIERFHVVERYSVTRALREGFSEIEFDAKRLHATDKRVPSAIVEYLRCMGEGVMATDDYQSGDAINYIGVSGPCNESAIQPTKGNVSGAEANSIRALYLRFQRRGRLTFPLARQALRRSPGGARLPLVREYDRSFLNVGLVKEFAND